MLESKGVLLSSTAGGTEAAVAAAEELFVSEVTLLLSATPPCRVVNPVEGGTKYTVNELNEGAWLVEAG